MAAKQGQDAFLQETRGKGSGSIGSQDGSLEEKLAKANARIVYLEGNLTLVKKLELHERSVKNGTKDILKIHERYALINHIIREYQLQGMVKHLCEIAEVSRSGYYYLVMNHKKIRRILRMNGVISPIRKANPYRKIMKATQEHKTKKI